jgi:hypothetical protein
VTFHYSTRAQLLARLRVRYATATGREAVQIAAFLATASDGELRSAFGVAAGQTAALRARLQAQAAKADAMRQAVGE